jgi:xylan 1,4-beta-xylosidase
MDFHDMNYQLENVEHLKNLPIRTFFHSIKECSYHWHRDIELLFVLSGTILVQAEYQEFLLRKNDLFLIGSGDIHLTHESGYNNLILALQINPSFIEKHDPDIARRKFDFNPTFVQHPDLPQFKTIREIMALIMWEMRTKKQGYMLKMESLVYQLFSILLRDFTHTLSEVKMEEKFNGENASYYPRIRRIIQLVEKGYEEKISLAEIAKKEKLSLGYLSRFFKETTGCKFTEFVNLIRVKKSLPELVNTDQKITEIALNSGFADVKAYNMFFKRTYKTTPSKWRREFKEHPAISDGLAQDAYMKIDPKSAISILKEYIPDIIL